VTPSDAGAWDSMKGVLSITYYGAEADCSILGGGKKKRQATSLSDKFVAPTKKGRADFQAAKKIAEPSGGERKKRESEHFGREKVLKGFEDISGREGVIQQGTCERRKLNNCRLEWRKKKKMGSARQLYIEHRFREKRAPHVRKGEETVFFEEEKKAGRP